MGSPKSQIFKQLSHGSTKISLPYEEVPKKPELHEKMNEVIQGALTVDPPHARKITKQEGIKTSDMTWYLPIHLVSNPNKPGNDGEVCNVEVKTKDGVYTRPVTKSYQLKDDTEDISLGDVVDRRASKSHLN